MGDLGEGASTGEGEGSRGGVAGGGGELRRGVGTRVAAGAEGVALRGEDLGGAGVVITTSISILCFGRGKSAAGVFEGPGFGEASFAASGEGMTLLSTNSGSLSILAGRSGVGELRLTESNDVV